MTGATSMVVEYSGFWIRCISFWKKENRFGLLKEDFHLKEDF